MTGTAIMKIDYYVGDSAYIDDIRKLTGRDTKTEVMQDALVTFNCLVSRLATGEKVFVGKNRLAAEEWTLGQLRKARPDLKHTERQHARGIITDPFNYVAEDRNGDVVDAMKKLVGTYDTRDVMDAALAVHQSLAAKTIVQGMKVFIGRHQDAAQEVPFAVYENARRMIGQHRLLRSPPKVIN